MNKIAFIYSTETRRLRKIIRKTRNKELYRRANAVLLVLEGHSKAEVAGLLHAGRSSVIPWMTWYEVAGSDGLNTKELGRRPKLLRTFICGELKIMPKFTPRNTGYQRSRWSSEVFALLLKKFCNIEIHSSTNRRWLLQEGIVWRRAAPTLYIQAP
jgi:transposase